MDMEAARYAAVRRELEVDRDELAVGLGGGGAEGERSPLAGFTSVCPVTAMSILSRRLHAALS
jgi:hypothetical protein